MLGKTLGHYRIKEKIGAGGMGEVYRAHDDQLDRDVAIKVLPASSFGDTTARARLLKEARTAAALNHPNICTIHEVGDAGGEVYIAMELVGGLPLNLHVAAGGVREEQVLSYGLQVADALSHAHERGVVHRDLKSANVIITPAGRAKVLDFGLAKRLSKEELTEAATQPLDSLTQPGALVGTLAYMAPEQLRGQPADARSDVWALGVVLYEMATRVLPFQGQTGFELSSAILNSRPAPMPGKVQFTLRAVIGRCLEKEPVRRYQRGGEVRAALEGIQAGGGTPWAAWRYRLARRPRLMLALAMVVLLSVLTTLNGGRLRRRFFGSASAPRIDSLAVLPLANLSGEPEQEYFADGMTEELITDLAKIRALKVISRTSVMQYKGVRKPLPLIARELGVDAVIEGSVLREGNQVRITVQLIHGKTDQHLWVDSYQRELRGVMALQSEVAQAIANEIKVELTPQEQAQLTSTRPVNPEAYQLYLKGNFQLLKNNEEAFRRAIEYFEQAIAKDSTYAPAYAGLSMAYGEMGSWFGSLSQEDIRFKAEEAAMKAVQTDDRLGEAHLALGEVKRYFAWDWPGTESEFRRGMELNPNSSWARMNFANHLTAMGRFEESIAVGKQTLEIDPLSPAVYNELGWALKQAGQYQAALEQYGKGLELDPDFEQSHILLAELYLETGRYQEALAETDKLMGLAPGKDSRSFAANFYARAGRRAEARKILNELKKRAKHESVSPVAFARIFAGLGETDQALNLLEKAFADRDVRLVLLKAESTWAPLRSNPRFQDLLRRMNFQL